MFNDLKANTAYPWLATDFAWNADGTQITFTLRDGVKFSDGSPLTADDVAYTFQVMKDTPAANRAGLPDRQRRRPTAPTRSPSPSPLRSSRTSSTSPGQTFIVKKSVYSARAATRPSSPTRSRSAPARTRWASSAPRACTFKANPTYWGGKPPVPEVDVPSYSTNDVALQQLSAGKIDYAGNFVDQIKTTFVAKDPAHNKYWFPAINVVNLVFNVATGPKALQDAAGAQGHQRGHRPHQGRRPGRAGLRGSGHVVQRSAAAELLGLLPAAYKGDLKSGTDAAAVASS